MSLKEASPGTTMKSWVLPPLFQPMPGTLLPVANIQLLLLPLWSPSMHCPATTTINTLKLTSLIHHSHTRSPEPVQETKPVYRMNQFRGVYWKRLEPFPQHEAVLLVVIVRWSKDIENHKVRKLLTFKSPSANIKEKVPETLHLLISPFKSDQAWGSAP